MAVELVVSVVDDRVDGGFRDDVVLGFSGDACVADLLSCFGSSDGFLKVRAATANVSSNFAGSTLLGDCRLTHGDELVLSAAVEEVASTGVDGDVFGGLGLVQMDGAERGKFIRVPGSEVVHLTLLPDNDFCWSRSPSGLESSVDSFVGLS